MVEISRDAKYSIDKLLDIYDYSFIDPNLFSDLRYYIGRICGVVEKNEEIEARRDFSSFNSYENIDEFKLRYHAFIENFTRCYNINRFNFDIKDRSEEVMSYIDSTYPYCFCYDGSIKTLDMDSALLFYAKYNLGADDSKLDEIFNILKSKKLDIIERNYFYEEEEHMGIVTTSSVQGSTVEKYSKDNLYDTLYMLDDKNIKFFINYIMRYNAVTNPNNVFNSSKLYLYTPGNGYYYTEDGNHRIYTIKALQEIRKFVTGRDDCTCVMSSISKPKKLSLK